MLSSIQGGDFSKKDGKITHFALDFGRFEVLVFVSYFWNRYIYGISGTVLRSVKEIILNVTWLGSCFTPMKRICRDQRSLSECC